MHSFLLAKVWFTAQILPPPVDCFRQKKHGSVIFCVPLSTLYKKKEHRGWALLNIAAKCCALILYRLQAQGRKTGPLTAKWPEERNFLHPRKNHPPPHRDRIPAKLEYLRQLEMDTAYITPQGQGESVTTYRRRIHEFLLALMQAEARPIGMRVERLWPDTDWDVVWKNLWTTIGPESVKASWYRIIHNIVPTPERLHKIRITPTEQCRLCAEKDTL